MYLDQFYKKNSNIIRVEPEQGSRFAKEVAGDFNPLHNPENKRFCVPGDLLFSMVLCEYGISAKMKFQFKGMVGKDAELVFPETDAAEFEIQDTTGKGYMSVEREGDTLKDRKRVEMLSRGYVSFSGQSFPFILVPLLEQQQTMINPDRPLVIYESMYFELKHQEFENLSMRLGDAALDVKGKRGAVALDFNMMDGDEVIGCGRKTMLISGLVPYDKSEVDRLNRTYEQWKADYEEQMSGIESAGC